MPPGAIAPGPELMEAEDVSPCATDFRAAMNAPDRRDLLLRAAGSQFQPIPAIR